MTSLTSTQKKEVLIAAASMFEAGRFCKEVEARDARGNPTSCLNPEATQFCIVGALRSAYNRLFGSKSGLHPNELSDILDLIGYMQNYVAAPHLGVYGDSIWPDGRKLGGIFREAAQKLN